MPIGAWISPLHAPDQLIDVGERSINGNDVDDIEDEDKHDITCFLDLPDEACVKTSIRHIYYLEDDSVVCSRG